MYRDRVFQYWRVIEMQVPKGLLVVVADRGQGLHVCAAGRALVVVTVETLPSLGSSMRRLLRRALACSFARESTNLSTTSG